MARIRGACLRAGDERTIGARATRIDVDDGASIDAALENVSVVAACVRQKE